MPRILKRTAFGIGIWAIASSTALGAWLDPCATARLVASWKRDGFWRTSSIDGPYRAGNQVRFVEKILAGGRAYKIYFDDSADPAPPHHGNQDLIVTSVSGKFLGLYPAADIVDGYGEPVRTEGSDILFPPGKANGVAFDNRLHFGSKGPPKTLHQHLGHDLTFSTPAEFREAFPRLKPWPEPGPRLATYCRR